MSQSQKTWEEAVRDLIQDPDQTELVEACYFDLPLAAATRRYHKSAEWLQIRSFLPPAPACVIDLGAGNGIVALALARDGYESIAVEPDPSALVGAAAIRAVAAEEGVTVEVLEAFGERLPIDDGRVDAVVARQVLHHAADLERFTAEMARIVRPGGTVITLRDHVIDDEASLKTFLEKHPLHKIYGGENAFTLAVYEAALQSAGLRVAKCLRPFDGPMNMAPRTMLQVREEITNRIARVLPVRGLVSGLLNFVSDAALAAVLNAIDRRPGRLYSFVCVKA